MENKQLMKNLTMIVIPIAAQNLLSALVSASDALMLGGLNQDSLSAVSLATQVTFIINMFYVGLTNGTTVLSAQYWGKGLKDKVEDILNLAMRYTAIVSTLFWFLSLFFPSMLMKIFTNDPTLIALGVRYLRPVSWSYLCMGITQIYLCIMKNTGRTLRSTIYGTVALISNLILNALLIYGLMGFPKLEIEGAALATTISRILELLLIVYENQKENVVKIQPRKFVHINKILNKDFITYTAPLLTNQLAWGCGFAMFSVIIGHLGTDAVAANSIANIVKNIIICVCMGLAAGTGIVVGNELGKGHLEEARALGNKLSRLSIITGAISGIILLLCRPLIFSMASTLSVQAKDYLDIMLYICSYYIIGKSINSTVIGGIFPAGGATKFGMICDTITMWAVVVPIGLIAAFVLKLPVLWVYFLLNTDEIIKLPAVYWYYKKYRWVKNITKE